MESSKNEGLTDEQKRIEYSNRVLKRYYAKKGLTGEALDQALQQANVNREKRRTHKPQKIKSPTVWYYREKLGLNEKELEKALEMYTERREMRTASKARKAKESETPS
jgi:membrane-bound lytic murein transglycosylase B